jgi:hypothetical protein
MAALDTALGSLDRERRMAEDQNSALREAGLKTTDHAAQSAFSGFARLLHIRRKRGGTQVLWVFVR